MEHAEVVRKGIEAAVAAVSVSAADQVPPKRVPPSMSILSSTCDRGEVTVCSSTRQMYT